MQVKTNSKWLSVHGACLSSRQNATDQHLCVLYFFVCAPTAMTAQVTHLRVA